MSLISIILPAYNSENFITEAINSVLSQTYQNFELIIVNDGSTDKTAEIINKFNDPRIKYFEFENNKGVVAARNLALSKMNGEFFCFLDADDEFTSDSLGCRIVKFDDPEISFVDGRVRMMDAELKVQLEHRKQTFQGMPLDALLSLDPSCFLGLTWMIRRDESVSYIFEEDMTNSEDLLFFITIASQGRYVAVDEDILLYRRGHLSASRNLKGLEKGYNQVHQYLIKHNVGSKNQRNFFLKKVRSIMFKSYLAAGNLLGAIRQII